MWLRRCGHEGDEEERESMRPLSSFVSSVMFSVDGFVYSHTIYKTISMRFLWKFFQINSPKFISTKVHFVELFSFVNASRRNIFSDSSCLDKNSFVSFPGRGTHIFILLVSKLARHMLIFYLKIFGYFDLCDSVYWVFAILAVDLEMTDFDPNNLFLCIC